MVVIAVVDLARLCIYIKYIQNGFFKIKKQTTFLNLNIFYTSLKNVIKFFAHKNNTFCLPLEKTTIFVCRFVGAISHPPVLDSSVVTKSAVK